MCVSNSFSAKLSSQLSNEINFFCNIVLGLGYLFIRIKLYLDHPMHKNQFGTEFPMQSIGPQTP